MENRRITFLQHHSANRINWRTAAPAAVAEAGTIATLTGYPIVWNALSTDRGGYKVRILPGAARFTPVVHALYHHQWDGGPLADTATRTLRILPANSVGVPVEIDLPDTTLGRDVLALVRDGRMAGASFAMVDEMKSNRRTEGGQIILEATDFLVDEVTITAIPAFAETWMGLKLPDASDATGYTSVARARLELERLKMAETENRFPDRTRHALKLEQLRFDALQLGLAPDVAM